MAELEDEHTQRGAAPAPPSPLAEAERLREAIAGLEREHDALLERAARGGRADLALAQAQDSERRFRELADHSPDAISVVTGDRTARPLYANAAFLHLFGFAALDEYLSLDRDEAVIAPHERERLRPYRPTPSAADEGAVEFEFDGVRVDGERVRVLRQVRSLDHAWSGGPAVLINSADVTDRERMERALGESEARFRGLAETSLQGICVVDLGPYAEILYANDAFAAMFGFHCVDEALGRDVLNTIVAAHEESRLRGYRRARAEGRPAPNDYEFDGQRRDGAEIRVRSFYRGLELPWGGRRVSLATFLDVTDRHLAERELEQHRGHLEQLVQERTRALEETQEELLRAERLAAVGRVTATIGHELRNPLGTIRASFYTLRSRHQGADETDRRILDRVERNIDRCLTMIRELLDYSRSGTAQLAPVAIGDWLDRLCGEVRQEMEIRLDAGFECNDLVAIDAERLRQALLNVIQNARHALLEASADVPVVEIGVQREGDEIVIGVVDRGPGMDAEVAARVFEPLFSTKSFGVGLGMPLVQRIVEQHGGKVTLDSEPGHGTTVAVRLPIAPR